MTDNEVYDYAMRNLKRIRFNKKNGFWYADVNGQEEMVNGAEMYLDATSEGDSILLEACDIPYRKVQLALKMKSQDDFGANYEILPDGYAIDYNLTRREIRLSSTLLSVFGYYPEYISIL